MQSDPDLSLNFDRTLADFLCDKYFDGEHSSFGSYTVAALEWQYPQIGRFGDVKLPLSRQSLKGWRKLAPSMTRLPMADPLASTIAIRLSCRSRAMGLALCVMRCTYFRPGELFKLKCRSIVPPSLGTLWAFTLHDFDPDDLNPSKTGEFDESAIIDLPEWAWLGPAVFELTRGRRPDDPLFQFSPLELGREMQSVAREELGVVPPPVLYMWRHTAASVEFLEKLRTLAEVKRRGRWQSDSSVRRYEKGGRVGEEFARLPQATRDFAKICHPLLRRVLCGKLRAPRPPVF